MDTDEIKDLLHSMSEMISNTNEKIDSLEKKIDKLPTREWFLSLLKTLL